MGKKFKTLISLLIGIPAFIIFCSESELKFFGIQLLAGVVLFSLLVWNGMTNIKIGGNKNV